VSSLSGTYIDAPLQGMAYCLARAAWHFFSDSPLVLLKRYPRLTLMQRQPEALPNLLASDHVSMDKTLTLLIKMPATVTVYRGHRRTLYFLPGIVCV